MSAAQPILFFSRGRGYGHAIPDIAITQELLRLHPGATVRFASYATGAEVFRKADIPVIDLQQPENNGFVSTLLACHQVISAECPAVVVSHEEFPALVAAQLAGVPSIFISAWLPRLGTPGAEALTCASSTIVIEDPGVFPVPLGVQGQPFYTGPILRKLQCSLADRTEARRAMQLAPDAVCLVVIPGGSSSEAEFPIADIVLSAFFRMPQAHKKLVWVSAKDFEPLTRRFAGIPDTEVIRYYTPIEKLLIAADVVITKGTRGTTLDTATLGIPSISLSPGTNPIDDILVARVHSNTALTAKAVDGEILHHYIEKALAAPKTPQPARDPSALTLCARQLHKEIRRLSTRASTSTKRPAVAVAPPS